MMMMMMMMKLSRRLHTRRRPAPGAVYSCSSSAAAMLAAVSSNLKNKQQNHYCFSSSSGTTARKACSPPTSGANNANKGVMFAAAGVVATGLCLLYSAHNHDGDSRLKKEQERQPSCSISNKTAAVLSLSFPNAATTTRLDDDGSEPFYSGIFPFSRSRLRGYKTVNRLEQTSARGETLESKYVVNWKEPLGRGAFGAVYVATNRKTQEKVAVKKISQRYTDSEAFQREADALLHIRACGGHPNICGLRENYNPKGDGHFYLVLDLVSGGEMFDNLCNQGAYSEADAAHMVRDIASALAFMHGIGIVQYVLHCYFIFMFL
jgi:Protein kinase domain